MTTNKINELTKKYAHVKRGLPAADDIELMRYHADTVEGAALALERHKLMLKHGIYDLRDALSNCQERYEKAEQRLLELESSSCPTDRQAELYARDYIRELRADYKVLAGAYNQALEQLPLKEVL